MSTVAPTIETAGEHSDRLGVVQSRLMTYEEFLGWAPEGDLTEWIDGEGVQHIPATQTHQDLAGFLHALLRFFLAATKLGRVFAGPYTMRTPTGWQKCA